MVRKRVGLVAFAAAGLRPLRFSRRAGVAAIGRDLSVRRLPIALQDGANAMTGSHVVQLLVPLRDNDGAPFEAALFTRIRTALTERFGGVTAYSRAPAQGEWKDGDAAVVRDDVVIYEVVVDTLDEDWWREYGAELRRVFRQEELMIRAVPCLRL